jgi:hypothetical protein
MGHWQGSSRRGGRAPNFLGIVMNCEGLLPDSLLDVLQRLDLQRPYSQSEPGQAAGKRGRSGPGEEHWAGNS